MHTSSRCWDGGCTFGHRQRRCDMLAVVFCKLLSGECTTRYDHGRLTKSMKLYAASPRA